MFSRMPLIFLSFYVSVYFLSGTITRQNIFVTPLKPCPGAAKLVSGSRAGVIVPARRSGKLLKTGLSVVSGGCPRLVLSFEPQKRETIAQGSIHKNVLFNEVVTGSNEEADILCLDISAITGCRISRSPEIKAMNIRIYLCRNCGKSSPHTSLCDNSTLLPRLNSYSQLPLPSLLRAHAPPYRGRTCMSVLA